MTYKLCPGGVMLVEPDVSTFFPEGSAGYAEFEAWQAQGNSPEQEPLPALVCSRWQIRKALNLAGLRAAVEAAVASGSQDLKDGWEFANEFRSDDPLVLEMGVALGKSPEEIREVIALAITL